MFSRYSVNSIFRKVNLSYRIFSEMVRLLSLIIIIALYRKETNTESETEFQKRDLRY